MVRHSYAPRSDGARAAHDMWNRLRWTVCDKSMLTMRCGRHTGPIPSQIGRLNMLSDLWLHNNKLTGAKSTISEFWLSCMSRTCMLELLAMTKSQPLANTSYVCVHSPACKWEQLDTGRIPSEMGRLQRLTQLGLRNNQFTGAYFVPICLGKWVSRTSAMLMCLAYALLPRSYSHRDLST